MQARSTLYYSVTWSGLWTCAEREDGTVEHHAREGDEVQVSHVNEIL